MGGEQLQSRLVAARVTVIPPRRKGLVLAKLIYPCGKASLAVTEGQERFTKKSQLQVAKILVDLTDDVIPLRLLNPTDQPQIVY